MIINSDNQWLLLEKKNNHAHISGSVTPRSAYAFCRALRHAIRMDSVPPLVVTPAAPGGALYMVRTCWWLASVTKGI